jgi:hypothetical protein
MKKYLREQQERDAKIAWYMEELRKSWDVTIECGAKKRPKQTRTFWTVRVGHPWGNESYTYSGYSLVQVLCKAHKDLPKRPRFFTQIAFDARCETEA